MSFLVVSNYDRKDAMLSFVICKTYSSILSVGWILKVLYLHLHYTEKFEELQFWTTNDTVLTFVLVM